MQENYSGILSLVSKIHSSSASFLKEQLKNEGLSDFVSSHGNILFQLSIAEKMTMKQLSDSIHRDKSTTTVLVNKLEKEGYVKRETSTSDNRFTYIVSTDKARSYNEITSKISERLISRCYKGFSDEEKKIVFELLVRISQNFLQE